MKLTLETRDQEDRTVILRGEPQPRAERGEPRAKPVAVTPGVALMTPEVSEDYWQYRVRLTDKQAVLGFPKFMTIGIGFAVEAADWNTNLPFQAPAKKILEHIRVNKGDDAILDADVLKAIRMIQAAAKEFYSRKIMTPRRPPGGPAEILPTDTANDVSLKLFGDDRGRQ